MLKTIKRKVAGASLAIVVVCLASAGTGVWAITGLADDLERSNASSQILRNHMQADMMHDALRADVLSALLSTNPASGVKLEDVKKDLAEHVENFQSSLADNDKLATDPAVKAALAAVKPPLEIYIASAQKIVAQAGTDPVGATGAMPEFQKKFEILEGAMSDLLDELEREAATA